VSKYSDATVDQLQALLAIRGDFPSSEAKEVSFAFAAEFVNYKHESLTLG